MNRIRCRPAPFPLTVLVLALAPVSTRAAEVITYEVTPDVAAREYAVEVTVPRPQGPLRLQIPAWSPGAYIIGNYAANIAGLTARTRTGQVLAVSHPDRLTWEVASGSGAEVQIRYRVSNADLESSGGRPKRGHISGPRTYLYVVDRKQEPARLLVRVPIDWGWKFACSLDPLPGVAGRDGVGFDAPDYDTLADAPVEMGDFAEDEFSVRGVPHRIVLYGDHSAVDRPKLREYCRRTAEEITSFFHDVPFRRYVYLFRCSSSGRGGGGLEHLGSTEISLNGPTSDTHRSVIAHEYFHAWNVKRIRPAVLGPFDYTGPVRTNNLWWSEGVTSYYGDLLSRRARINTVEEYLKHAGDTIGQLQANPARLQVTAEESSYKVWDGGGSQGFGRLSYYTKGELIGICLDLKIRYVTNNRRSLDDVMRSLYSECAKGRGPGFPEDAIRQTVSRIAGQDLGSFYDLLVRSRDEMPFAECLGYAGLTASISSTPIISPDPGMFARPEPGGKAFRVRFVTSGGPAERAGLKPDDLIVAIDGKPVNLAADAPAADRTPDFRSRSAGASLALTVERDGARSTVAYVIGSTERRPWVVESAPTPTLQQTRLRDSWLGSGTTR